MKITSVKAIASAPDDVRMGPTGGTRNYIYVKVETDEGLVGWGEATIGPLSMVQVVEEYGQTWLEKIRVGSRTIGRTSITTFNTSGAAQCI